MRNFFKYSKILILSLILISGLFFSLEVFAQAEPLNTGQITVDDLGLTQIEDDIGLPNTDIRLVVARIIRTALGILGIVALVLILYAGFVWMTAGGNEDKVKQSKQILFNAAIGLAIILSAYAIASFVINSLAGATGGSFGDGDYTGPGDGPGGFSSNELYIIGMPEDGFGCGARNIHPIISFNRAVNLEKVKGNIVIRKAEGSFEEAKGEWNYATTKDRIVFNPEGECGEDYPQNNDCLEADTTYEIYFKNNSNIESLNHPYKSLNCNIGNFIKACSNNPSVKLETGSGIDTKAPNITIISPFNDDNFPQGQIIPFKITAQDDFGIQNISLIFNNETADSISLSGCQKSINTTLYWNTQGVPISTYTVTALTSDIANNTARDERRISLLPDHCFDNELNFGETEAGPPACGNGCKNCAGESCQDNSDCASSWCVEGKCVDRMRIDDFTPGDGAVSTTLVTIYGQYFGKYGEVYFRKKDTNDGWTQASVAHCGRGVNNWHTNQIIVRVPADARSGPIKVVTGEWEDITDGSDNWGVIKSFEVNDKVRPALCTVSPDFSLPYEYVELVGENFGEETSEQNKKVIFGENIEALIQSWSNTSIKARVPGLAKGLSMVKVKSKDQESNSLHFSVLESALSKLPTIESIYPESGGKGEYITITGYDFGEYTGKVLFKKDGEGEAIYGDFSFPEKCKNSVWTDKQIIVKMPSTASLGKYSIQIQKSNSDIGPIGATFELKDEAPAPGICFISPSESPIPLQKTLSIYGEYFTPSTAVYFWKNGASANSIQDRIKIQNLSVCIIGDCKDNPRIDINQLPATVETGPVVASSADNKMSNNLSFRVFNCLENNKQCSDESLKCCPVADKYGICVETFELCPDETRSTNFVWRFNTGPFPPALRVVERCDSLTESGKLLPSPTPNIKWTIGGNNDHYNVCRNALVNIVFSAKIDETTLSENTLQIFKCKSGSVGDTYLHQKNTCTRDGGPLDLDPTSYTNASADSNGLNNSFFLQAKLKNNKSWENDTYYQVVLKKGIKSESSEYYLNGEFKKFSPQLLEATNPCDDESAYCFLFKTNDRDCRLRDVIVAPTKYWTAILEEPIRYRDIKDNSEDLGTPLYWRGLGLSDQRCIMMNMDNFEWEWYAEDQNYTNIYNTPTGTNNELAEFSALRNTVAVGLENDAVKIFATARARTSDNNKEEIKTNFSLLTIDLSEPKVIDYWPKCLEACTNAEVGLKFNIMMSNYGLDNAIKLYKCDNENCSNLNSNNEVDASIKLGGDRRSVVISTFNEFLDPDTLYQVMISGAWSGSSLNSLSSYGRQMKESFTWRFKTKKELCVLDSVNVLPSVFFASRIGEKKIYSAEARSSPDNCDPKGQKLNTWLLDWEWKSSSTSVAKLDSFKTLGVNPFCTSNCLKKGSDISFGSPPMPICGNGVIEAGEDCDPPFITSEGVVTCDFNCLNPNKTNKGSEKSPKSTETTASICGNGLIGDGEDCDIGVTPDYRSTTSSYACSDECLHLGSKLSSAWCVEELSGNSNFSREVLLDACEKSISQCGDGITNLNEDEGCELGNGKINSNCNEYCLFSAENYLNCELSCGGCNENGENCNIIFSEGCSEESYKYCTPSCSCDKNGTNCSIYFPEGCNEIGELSGSSLLYSTPSLCGDGKVGIGEDPFCEETQLIKQNHFFIDPWALATAIGEGSPAIDSNVQLAKIQAKGKQKTNIGSGEKTAENAGDFMIACGFDSNEQCARINGENYAVANNSCCYLRSKLISKYPENKTENICRNSYIELKFDRSLDAKTIAGNILIARASSSTKCQAGEVDVSLLFALENKEMSWFEKIYNKIASFIKKIFGYEAIASTNPPAAFCLADDLGVPELLVNEDYIHATSTLTINLKKPLAPNVTYYILVREGLKDLLGVSVKPVNDWYFTTGENVCEINKVEIEPAEHIFTAPNTEKIFQSFALPTSQQKIQSIAGYYSWDFVWAPLENEYVTLENEKTTINKITSKNRMGELDVMASVKIKDNVFSAAGEGITGKTHLTLYFCQNPWTKNIFEDLDYDFRTFYCRDYGLDGFGDDLPNFDSTVEFEFTGEEFLKRYVFTNKDNKDAIGIQIFSNPEHLSVQDWYQQRFFGKSNMLSLKIDGYDAITDGDNYYIDVMKTETSRNENYYTNIFQISINNDSTQESREVFEQIQSNLSFNIGLTKSSANYCASDSNGSNVNYKMPCNTDLDCLAQIEAIKEIDPTADFNQFICLNKKEKLQRDYQRLKDVRFIVSSLEGSREDYSVNKKYPSIIENTFLPGQAISTWVNAWGQLNKESDNIFPTDPINKLAKVGSCIHPIDDKFTLCYKDNDCAIAPTDKRKSYWNADKENEEDVGELKNHVFFDGSIGFAEGVGYGSSFEFYGEEESKITAEFVNYSSTSSPPEYLYFNNENDQTFSISTWIYPTKRNTATIIKQGGTDENGKNIGGFEISFSGFQIIGPDDLSNPLFNNRTIRFAIFPDSNKSNSYYFVDSKTPLALNKWHHIVAIYNPAESKNKLKLYINGNEDVFPAYFNDNAELSEVDNYNSIIPKKSPEPIEIGQSFNGNIDNIAYYSKALSFNEVSSLYNGICVPHDLETGWSAEDRRFLFACNPSSYAYRYIYNKDNNDLNRKESFSLKLNFEYFTKIASPSNLEQLFIDFLVINNRDGFEKNKVDYENGICLDDKEIISPYANVCGDGVVGLGEECDPPGKVIYDISGCPNKIVERKLCDKNCKFVANTATNITCREAVGGSCGDGIIQYLAGEKCDDGSLNGKSGYCNSECSGYVNTCGNGVLDPGEFCDTVGGKCTFRAGVEYETGLTVSPIFYFLIDLTGSMSNSLEGDILSKTFLGENLAKTLGINVTTTEKDENNNTIVVDYKMNRLDLAKYSLYKIIESIGDTSKIGIGPVSNPTKINFHTRNWLEDDYFNVVIETGSDKFKKKNDPNTPVGSTATLNSFFSFVNIDNSVLIKPEYTNKIIENSIKDNSNFFTFNTPVVKKYNIKTNGTTKLMIQQKIADLQLYKSSSGGGQYAKDIFALWLPELLNKIKEENGVNNPIHLIFITDGGIDSKHYDSTSLPTISRCFSGDIKNILINNENVNFHILSIDKIDQCGYQTKFSGFTTDKNIKGRAHFHDVDSGNPSSIINTIMDIYYSNPCSEYNRFSGFSCSWDCNNFGGYCGDGIVQKEEVCEIGQKQDCTIGNQKGIQTCKDNCKGWGNCIIDTTTNPSVPPTCGNGIVEEFEACDLGAGKNGIPCDPKNSSTGRCTYCSYDCKNIITVDKI